MSAVSLLTPTGLHFGLTYAEYCALPGITASALKAIRKSPRHYQHQLTHRKETRAMSLGRAAHCAVLEPARFQAEYAAWTRKSENGNSCPRKGQYWDAFLGANAGKEVITEQEHEAALAIGAAVRGDSVAGPYLDRGCPEVSVCATVAGTQMRARLDWLTGEGPFTVIELKTAQDIREIPFGNAAARMGYHVQTAVYADILAAATGAEVRVKVIAVESAAPHDVAVYDVPMEIIEQGRDEYLQLVDTLIRCQDDGMWPGVAGGEEKTLSLPSWLYGRDEELSELGLEG